jgi:succinoglycan biosynthesis transport protein ExoP
MDFERELTLSDYINVVKRRFPYVIGCFCLVFPALVAIAILLSPTYRSTATILIESQQVRSDEARERFASDRFAKLKQVVLSKDNIIKIAKKYKLYGLDKNPKISSETLYTATRANISVERLLAESEGWEAGKAFAFEVSFTHYKDQETYDIANDLVKMFLDENDRVSKGQVFETEEFFSKEEAKRREDLEKIEAKVTSYKRMYADSLPENKEIYVASLERLENDLRANQLEYRATQAELRSLDVSLESARAGVGLNTPQQPISASTDLDVLRQELAKQKSIYSDNHPSVRVLQRRIDALEKVTPVDSAKPDKPVTLQSVMVEKVQAQIDTANDRLKALRAEEANIRAKIGQTERSVMRSTQTEGALGALLRDYEAAKTAYAEIKGKLDNSKIAKNIELEDKGERFILVEAPVFPEKPIKPNRLLIIFAGFFASIAASIGLAFLIDMLDKRVRGVAALAEVMKIQPMATIPYIYNKAELRHKKHIISYILMVVFVLTLLFLLVMHFFVMPLDVLMAKIIARF